MTQTDPAATVERAARHEQRRRTAHYQDVLTEASETAATAQALAERSHAGAVSSLDGLFECKDPVEALLADTQENRAADDRAAEEWHPAFRHRSRWDAAGGNGRW